MNRRSREAFPGWQGLHAGVIGAGRSGLSAAKLLYSLGSDVLLSDNGNSRPHLPRGIRLEMGAHRESLLKCDLLIRSPGVSGHLAVLQRAKRLKIPIWSEIELASRLASPRQFVAITGTNGKTTTTALVGELFKAGWRHGRTFVGGNIGIPYAEFARQVRSRDAVVLEVSSYQMEDVDTLHPTISAILNITPDHLEHHGSMAAYAAAKARILENQTGRDVSVLNFDDRRCRRLARKTKAKLFYFSRRNRLREGIWFKDGIVTVKWGSIHDSWPLEWALPGPHNVENGLAAIAIALAAGIGIRSIQNVFRSFAGVEHRLEKVRNLEGVGYINDSKATNVDSTRVALESFEDPLIVIMGGRGKGSPYSPLRQLVKKHVRHILLIGEDAPAIKRDLKGTTVLEECGTMARAVARARDIGRDGDLVLLSPACASFDQYGNYEDRGRHFKELVNRLAPR